MTNVALELGSSVDEENGMLSVVRVYMEGMGTLR